MKNAFSLIDIMLTLIVIGILFSLTIPVVNKNNYEHDVITGIKTFNSDLQSAIDQWKQELNCPYKSGTCIKLQKELLYINPNFNQIGKYLKIGEKISPNSNDQSFLPFKTLNYPGTAKSIYDFRTNNKRDVYLLLNGMAFSVLTDNDGYWIVVDVNGKKPPNRIGKDTFHLCVGYDTDNDITFYPKVNTNDGLCGFMEPNRETKCNPNNIDPRLSGGASPLPYVIANQKLPDFVSLSKKFKGFKP